MNTPQPSPGEKGGSDSADTLWGLWVPELAGAWCCPKPPAGWQWVLTPLPCDNIFQPPTQGPGGGTAVKTGSETPGQGTGKTLREAGMARRVWGSELQPGCAPTLPRGAAGCQGSGRSPRGMSTWAGRGCPHSHRRAAAPRDVLSPLELFGILRWHLRAHPNASAHVWVHGVTPSAPRTGKTCPSPEGLPQSTAGSSDGQGGHMPCPSCRCPLKLCLAAQASRECCSTLQNPRGWLLISHRKPQKH